MGYSRLYRWCINGGRRANWLGPFGMCPLDLRFRHSSAKDGYLYACRMLVSGFGDSVMIAMTPGEGIRREPVLTMYILLRKRLAIVTCIPRSVSPCCKRLQSPLLIGHLRYGPCMSFSYRRCVPCPYNVRPPSLIIPLYLLEPLVVLRLYKYLCPVHSRARYHLTESLIRRAGERTNCTLIYFSTRKR